MDTLSPLDARARSVAPRTRRDSIANAGADRRVATRDPENRVGAGSRLAPEGFARADARDRGRAVAGAAWHVAIVAEIIPSSRIRACKDACAGGSAAEAPRKLPDASPPPDSADIFTMAMARPPLSSTRDHPRKATRSLMSRAFIVASTSAGLVAPGRAPAARPALVPAAPIPSPSSRSAGPQPSLRR